MLEGIFSIAGIAQNIVADLLLRFFDGTIAKIKRILIDDAVRNAVQGALSDTENLNMPEISINLDIENLVIKEVYAILENSPVVKGINEEEVEIDTASISFLTTERRFAITQDEIASLKATIKNRS